MEAGEISFDYFNHSSKRLKFRKLTEADAETWKLFFTPDNESLKYFHFKFKGGLNSFASQWIQQQIQRYHERGLGQLAVIEKETGAFIGVGGIVPRNIHGREELELTVSLLPKYWGNGYGPETMSHFHEIGCNAGIAKEFISVCHRENDRINWSMLKCGFEIREQIEQGGRPLFIYTTAP